MPEPAASPVMTYAEVAESMGVAQRTILGYVQKGKLNRASPPYTPLSQALLYRHEVEALAETLRQWKQDRALGSQIVEGTKRCSKCREWKPTAQYDRCKSTKTGLMSWCRSCSNISSKRWYEQNWARERAKRDAYKAAHREQFRLYRRRAYRRDPHKNYLQHKRWVERNRERVNAYARAYHRIKDAIAWGQSSPITKKAGFALVSDKNGRWRAARLDVPFGQGEVGIVEFKPPLSSTGRWVVSPWRVLEVRHRATAERICKRHNGNKTRRTVGNNNGNS